MDANGCMLLPFLSADELACSDIATLTQPSGQCNVFRRCRLSAEFIRNGPFDLRLALLEE